MKCCVIIVTYNSENHIHHCLRCLLNQTMQPDKIIIVDTGSDDRSYLEAYHNNPQIEIHFAKKNSGFCHGNNVGYSYVPKNTDYVFLLNPDAFVEKNYLAEAIKFMEKPKKQIFGALTGKSLGYDISKNAPTGTYDTTGIFRKWYGRWYDRGQGEKVCSKKYNTPQNIPAICGAVFFCRKKALDSVIIDGNYIFNPSFYMYKEDIDLSIRLRKKGWKLQYLPHLEAFHCRGWNCDRNKVPRKMRLHSVQNELKIQLKTFNPIATFYTMVKFAGVLIFDM